MIGEPYNLLFEDPHFFVNKMLKTETSWDFPKDSQMKRCNTCGDTMQGVISGIDEFDSSGSTRTDPRDGEINLQDNWKEFALEFIINFYDHTFA